MFLLYPPAPACRGTRLWENAFSLCLQPSASTFNLLPSAFSLQPQPSAFCLQPQPGLLVPPRPPWALKNGRGLPRILVCWGYPGAPPNPQKHLKIVPCFWSRFYLKSGAKIVSKMIKQISQILPWNVNDSEESQNRYFFTFWCPWSLKMSVSLKRGAKINIFVHFPFFQECVKKHSILRPKSFNNYLKKRNLFVDDFLAQFWSHFGALEPSFWL